MISTCRYRFHRSSFVHLFISDRQVQDYHTDLLVCREPKNLDVHRLTNQSEETVDLGGKFSVMRYSDPQEQWRSVVSIRLPWRKVPDVCIPDNKRLGQYLDLLQSRLGFVLINEISVENDFSVVLTPLGSRYDELVIATMLGGISMVAEHWRRARCRKVLTAIIVANGHGEGFSTYIDSGQFEAYYFRNGHRPRFRFWQAAQHGVEPHALRSAD